MSMPWHEDGGYAWERREAGYTWDQIGSELGCPANVAQNLGERYHADVTAETAENQLSLFDLSTET